MSKERSCCAIGLWRCPRLSETPPYKVDLSAEIEHPDSIGLVRMVNKIAKTAKQENDEGTENSPSILSCDKARVC